MSKNHLISHDLMNLLVKYFIFEEKTEDLYKSIQDELNAKIDKMVKRDTYYEEHYRFRDQ